MVAAAGRSVGRCVVSLSVFGVSGPTSPVCAPSTSVAAGGGPMLPGYAPAGAKGAPTRGRESSTETRHR